ncbi:MAG: hypothetical protein ACJ75J_00340 [Cytophagaceae bacterium]
MKTINISIALVLSGLLFSCGGNTTEKKVEKDSIVKDSVSVPKDKDTVASVQNYDKKFENTARFISGIAQDKSSDLAALDTMKSWQSYARSSDSSWKMLEVNRFSKMRDWAKTELAEANSAKRNLFYPFSGPDVLNAIILFPNADTYTLLAMEPIGELPDLSKLNVAARNSYLESVEQSLNDLFKKSYFITKNMIGHLQKSKVNGTVPLMCVFLKRTGNTITDIQNVYVDSSGKELPRPYRNVGIDGAGNVNIKDDSARKVPGTPGVKISFLTSEGKPKTLYYYQVNLEDRLLKKNQGFITYLNQMKSVNSYLKSASYLLHYNEFVVARNLVFDKSECILQDDSGIAYDFFDKDKWNIQLYGSYAKPVNDFPHIKEPNLAKAYKTDSTVKPLPFTLGYHWGTKEVNMLRATRK